MTVLRAPWVRGLGRRKRSTHMFGYFIQGHERSRDVPVTTLAPPYHLTRCEGSCRYWKWLGSTASGGKCLQSSLPHEMSGTRAKQRHTGGKRKEAVFGEGSWLRRKRAVTDVMCRGSPDCEVSSQALPRERHRQPSAAPAARAAARCASAQSPPSAESLSPPPHAACPPGQSC